MSLPLHSSTIINVHHCKIKAEWVLTCKHEKLFLIQYLAKAGRIGNRREDRNALNFLQIFQSLNCTPETLIYASSLHPNLNTNSDTTLEHKVSRPLQPKASLSLVSSTVLADLKGESFSGNISINIRLG